MADKNFALKLKTFQAELNLTQQGIADALFGVPTRTVQSWILGEKEPPEYYQSLILYRLSQVKALNKQ